MDRRLCIHGHFYQPPRENPWLEAVELQDSAYPHHDWNERVTDDCYHPNALARILDGQGRIGSIVNNYARISFDFGPTLLSWLEEKAPEVYGAVLEADRLSAERFSGHGSALAQAYNHMILPLANMRDRRTQVIWGIRDFEHRFGRRPEGMWLPETAANTDSLEALAEHGIAFTVLAPTQARRARPLRGGRGRELNGDIDPSRAYVAHLPSGRTINLFFYDGPISRAVAFEGLLHSGETFAARLLSGFSDRREARQLVHIATDGETYGHHHRHGEMALAYALDHIDAMADVSLTNYGEYLEKEPPRHLVEIKEDTSWSCVHGVGRWMADCGCNSGGRPGWNQRWRAPLRQALDYLRDSLAPRYETAAGALLRDPWSARDAYIDVILDRTPENVHAFLGGQAHRDLSDEEKITALKLLELQRHAMLMYTSCGWFFDDLSGIETLQVLQYAGRVLQLAESVFGDNLEEEFLNRLASTRSNVPEHGDGRNVYEKLVKPALVDLPTVGAHYAVSSLFEDYSDRSQIYCYEVEQEETEQRSAGRAGLRIGRARITSRITWASERLTYAALHLGDHVVNGAVGRFEDDKDYGTFVGDATGAFESAEFVELIHLMESTFGGSNYSLASLFKDEQRKILGRVLDASLAAAEASYRGLHENYAPLVRFISTLRIPVPEALRLPGEFVLNAKLRDSLAADPPDVESIQELLNQARAESVRLDEVTLAFTAEESLGRLARRLVAEPDGQPWMATLNDLVAVIEETQFDVDLSEVQNAIFELRQKVRPDRVAAAQQGDQSAAEWVGLVDAVAGRIGLRVD